MVTAMNYYQARQREKDGRWDYTKRNDDDIHPVGYCAGWREWLTLANLTEEANEHYKRQWEAKVLLHRDKYHSDGHQTPEDAAECYKRYLLDQQLSLGRENHSSMHKCRVCGEFTHLFAEIDSQVWILCEHHNNRETVETLFEAPQQIISSY
jgi:hypothetical protein